MTLYKSTSLGLCLLLVAAAWTPLAAARSVRRTSIATSSRAAVSTSRRTAVVRRGGGAAVSTRRVTGVATSSRVAVSRSTAVYSRSYAYRGAVVYRPHGHYYHGYGGYHVDDDAWKWLAFTAITLKVLDNLNEEQQRKHETAQIQATTAPVGQAITWNDGNGSGSVTTTREGRDGSGNQCREFQQEVTIGSKTEQAYGTACLQPDGSWKIQD